jgi:hypothetical protein
MTKKYQKVTDSNRIYRVRNDRGVKVKKCCASCEYKDIDKDGNHVCRLMQILRNAKDKCPNWEMSQGLRNAGKPYGRVKSKQYLRYVLSMREQESLAIQEGRLQEIDRASLEDIREKYREQYGSIFLIS